MGFWSIHQGISCLATPPFWEFLTNWRGVARLNFSKKIWKFFPHFFLCTRNKNTVKIDYYSSAENIFHVLTESNTFYTRICGWYVLWVVSYCKIPTWISTRRGRVVRIHFWKFKKQGGVAREEGSQAWYTVIPRLRYYSKSLRNIIFS